MLRNFLLERTSRINFLVLSRVSPSASLGVEGSGSDLDETAVVATGVAGADMAGTGTGVGGGPVLEELVWDQVLVDFDDDFCHIKLVLPWQHKLQLPTLKPHPREMVYTHSGMKGM